jgi:deoxyribodipyrimidine photo-lyase
LRLAALGIALGNDYPRPVVDHAVRREQALALYKTAQAVAQPD